MAELAAEQPEEFAQIKRPVRPLEAEPEPWHDLYWRAWEALRYDRRTSVCGHAADGVQVISNYDLPVSYTAISRYAEDHGIRGSDFALFHHYFCVIDQEWLTYMHEQRAK